ncbi:OLC1v1030642C2 [Oldenlandia corymbosa var. corymbosa]|uniref:OLC1v1030642C2 n=1 Tax=Oldenlandia corymbosa var. corymbosa TaxID=529605 RepID=A0AAV1CHE4_OLDCO|nr:OLC1v1030642C2 [Oldenlandia corymbosa var. corymbosa]
MYPKGYESLSEEEEYLSQDSPRNHAIPLSGLFDNKGHEIQVLSELEKLQKHAYQDYGTINESQRAFCVEDEIECPAFNPEDDDINHPTIASMLDMDVKSIHDQRFDVSTVCYSDEEIVSDDEKATFTTRESSKFHAERNVWFKANEEVEASLQLNGNTCSSFKECINIKDGREKSMSKVFLPFQPYKEEFPLVVGNESDTDILQTGLKPTKDLEGSSNGDFRKSMAASLEMIEGREAEQLHKNEGFSENEMYCKFNRNSVAGFLDKLQENSYYPKGSGKQISRLRERKQFGVSRNLSPSSSENIEEESLIDDTPSVDDKPIQQQKTMSDLFHEALGALSPNDVLPEVEKHSLGVGLLDKLQHVMLREKADDVGFLESSATDNFSKDEKHCLDVRILSRSLEAKHNVCCCAIIPSEESTKLMNPLDMRRLNGERTFTVIFSSRICGDVDLDVGSEICIQPPWKEVRVRGQDGIILLSTYFSHIGV